LQSAYQSIYAVIALGRVHYFTVYKKWWRRWN